MIFRKDIRNYEVSIWTLQDGFITVLKQFGLENKERIQEPKMVLKDDGENTFSFSIPMYIFSNGEYKENPVWYTTRNGNLIANMRKIKVIFNKKDISEQVFEFIILKVTEKHEGFSKICEVECEGLAFHELGKQGYNINLSADNFRQEYMDWLENQTENKPIATIDYWVNKVLSNTNWEFLVCMDWSGQDGVLTYKDEGGNIKLVDNNQYIFDEGYRTIVDNYRKNKSLRSKQKIYRDPYVSSWKIQSNKLIADSEVTSLEELEFKTCIEESESNRYNLLQSIAEAFRVFCKFIFLYDDNYHIIGRKVVFYNNFINEANGILDFNYGYNTQNISREMDSNDLVSKLYVKSLSDAGVLGGEIYLSDSGANKSGENYLLNFDYLYNIGTITQEQYDEISVFIKNIKAKNNEYKEEIRQLQIYERDLNTVKSEITLREDMISEANARITEANSYLEGVVGSTPSVFTMNNPFIFSVIHGTQNKYSLVSLKGIKRATLKIYKTKNINNNTTTLTGEIVNYSIIEENGNISKIIYKEELSSNIKQVFATFEYDPDLPYKNIMSTYGNRLAADKNRLAELQIIEIQLKDNITTSNNTINTLIKEKEELISKFERMMGPALREGTWQPEDEYSNYQLNKIYNTNTSLTNITQTSSSAEASFIWDTAPFESEIQNYFTFSIEETIYYYPCLKLNSEMISDLNQTDLTDQIYLVYRDRDTTTYASSTDPRALHYLPLNAENGVQYAFLHEKNSTNSAIIPVLMVTGIKTKYIVGNTEYSLTAQAQFGARISRVTGYNEIDEEIGETILIDENKLNNQWIEENALDNYEIVYPRFQIDNKFFLENTIDKMISRNNESNIEFLEPNEDYYGPLFRNGKWYITLKYTAILEKLDAHYSLHYALSTAADAMYLDALQVAKENAYPKVSYEITPLAIDENFMKDAYNHLGQLAHINDDELKFQNVQGYISEVNLDLDKPWEDTYVIKNYKTKFEDIFSTIVAQTESMKKNSTILGMTANLITPEGLINREKLDQSLTREDVLNIIKDFIATPVDFSKLDSLNSSNRNFINKIINGDVGLNFGANEKIEKVVLNNQEGLLIQGKSSADGISRFFQVNHAQMGFFHYDNNTPVADLYYEDGYLYLNGGIIAQRGDIGGWTITKYSISKEATLENKKYNIYMSTNLYDENNNNPYNPVFCVKNITDNKYPFYVRSNGILHAEGAEISGNITAISLTIENKNANEWANDLIANNTNVTGKAKVFTGENKPTSPFHVGDIWTNGTNIYYCKQSLTSSGNSTYTQSNYWALASNYTDDTVANSKAKVFTSATPPTSGMKAGDIWVASGNDSDYPAGRTYRYTDDQWIAISAGVITGTKLVVDTDTGNINMSADNTITIAANKKLSLVTNGLCEISGNAGVTIGSGSQITISAGGNFNITANNNKFIISSNNTQDNPNLYIANNATWDSATSGIKYSIQNGLKVKGTITAGPGSWLGTPRPSNNPNYNYGWYIGSNYIGNANTRGNSKVGMSTGVNANHNLAFWAGGVATDDEYLDSNETSFYVTNDGKIKATKGTIGGWVIADNVLYKQNTTDSSLTGFINSPQGLRITTGEKIALWIGGAITDGSINNNNTDINHIAPFRVTNSGKLYADGAIITGSTRIGGQTTINTEGSVTITSSSFTVKDSDNKKHYLILDNVTANQSSITQYQGFQANSNFCKMGCAVTGATKYSYKRGFLISENSSTSFNFSPPTMTGFFTLNYADTSLTVMENKSNYIALENDNLIISGKPLVINSYRFIFREKNNADFISAQSAAGEQYTYVFRDANLDTSSLNSEIWQEIKIFRRKW